jgi:hypothetical protein
MKISIEHYIATNNPIEVSAILTKRGIPAPKNIADAIQKLRFVMSKEGNKVSEELAGIKTPYQELIVSSQEDKSEDKSNACGCSGFDSEQSSGCNGDKSCSCNKSSNVEGESAEKQVAPVAAAPVAAAPATTETTKDMMTKAAPLVVIGLLLVVTTAVLMKK